MGPILSRVSYARARSYNLEVDRIESFKRGSRECTEIDKMVARKGFYWNEAGTQVACFSCGLTFTYTARFSLLNLEVGHRHYSPKCKFLLTTADNMPKSREATSDVFSG